MKCVTQLHKAFITYTAVFLQITLPALSLSHVTFRLVVEFLPDGMYSKTGNKIEKIFKGAYVNTFIFTVDTKVP